MSKYIDEILVSFDQQFVSEGADKEAYKLIQKHYNAKIKDILKCYKTTEQLKIKNEEYIDLVMEARELYFQKFFYSCVILSCTIAECILRNIFYNNIHLNNHDLEEKSLKYLSFIDAKTICELLVCENVIERSLLASFKILGELQTKYSNIITKSPETDAQRALYHIMKILKKT